MTHPLRWRWWWWYCEDQGVKIWPLHRSFLRQEISVHVTFLYPARDYLLVQYGSWMGVEEAISTVIWKLLYIWEMNYITPTSASLTVTRVSQLASAAIRTNNVVTNGKGGTQGIRRAAFVSICRRKHKIWAYSCKVTPWRLFWSPYWKKRIYKTTFPIPLDKPLFLIKVTEYITNLLFAYRSRQVKTFRVGL